MIYKIVIDDNADARTIDQNYLYNPEDPLYQLENIKLDLSMAEAGQLQFTIYDDHPNYNLIDLGYKHVYVYRDSDIIFNGVISEIDRDIYNALTVYCTGVLGLLNYSIQSQKEYHETAWRYVNLMIIGHNSYVDENAGSFYDFRMGAVDPDYYGVNIYRYTNYETTLECIRRDVADSFGLYIKLTYENGLKYPTINLVKLENYGSLSSQEIRLGDNLLKYAENTSIDNRYTAVIPLGKKKDNSERTSSDIDALDAYVDIRSVNSNSVVLMNDAAIALYGFRCAVVHWEDVTQPSNLKTRAQAWLNTAQYDDLTLTLSAIDLAQLGNNIDEFKVGDRVRCVAEPLGLDVTLPIYEMTIYPQDPAKNTITVGSATPNGTASVSTASNTRADIDANQTLSGLVRIETYSYGYNNLSASAVLNVSATNLNISSISGYSPIAIRRLATGNASVTVRAWNVNASEDSAVVNLYNKGTSSASGTVTIDIVYVKSEVLY